MIVVLTVSEFEFHLLAFISTNHDGDFALSFPFLRGSLVFLRFNLPINFYNVFAESSNLNRKQDQ